MALDFGGQLMYDCFSVVRRKGVESMVTKEVLRTQIDQISDEDAEALYQLVQTFVQTRHREKKTGLLARLRQIKIEAEPDFATNLDQYLSGEKCGE